MTGAARGAIGGASGEVGSGHRASAAAVIATCGLTGRQVEGLFPRPGAGTPVLVRMETDDPTDDILCRTAVGRNAWVQAKHEVTIGTDGAGLTPVVDQWARMIRQGLVAHDDALVLAVARLTSRLRNLRSALDRRRDPHSGALTRDEQAALRIFTTQIQQVAPDLGAAAQQRLLDAAVIWRVDAGDAENVLVGRPVHGHDAQLAASWLATVVEPASAPQAMAVLTAAARTFAARRSGGAMPAWLAVLKAAGISVKADPEGLPASQLVARADVLGRYRAWLAQQAGTFALSNLGVAVSRLPCPGLADGITVGQAGSSDDNGSTLGRLLPAIRRRHRCILRGLPGGGKSVALTEIAGTWAADDAAPLPVLVRLQDVSNAQSEGLRGRIFTRHLAHAAAAACPEQDKDLLADELRQQIDSGQTCLLLDGLDECRAARHEIAQALNDWLRGAHPDTCLVMTTRDSAYASATILQLPELVLLEPADLTRTMRRLLEHVADVQAPKGGRTEWIEQRWGYLEDARDSGEEFWRVPLFAVMLTLLVAHRGPAGLPSNQARLLHEVVVEVTRQWEVQHRHGDRIRIGTFDGELAEGAFIDSFATLGFALAETGQERSDTLRRLVATRLHDRWGLPPGVAEVGADQIARLWDEAGVFVAAADGTTNARARLFAEVAAAIAIDALPEEEHRDWLATHLRDGEWQQAIELAAQLSARTCGVLVGLAKSASTPEAGLLLIRARRHGAPLALDQLRRVWHHLLGSLDSQSDIRNRWDIVRNLAEEPLPADLHDHVLPILVNAVPVRSTMIKTLAAAHWVSQTDHDQAWRRPALVALLVEGQPPPLDGPDVEPGFLVAPEYTDAVVAAGKALIPAYPEEASVVAGVLGKIPMAASMELERHLARHGHQDLLSKDGTRFDVLAHADRFFHDPAWSGWLASLAEHVEPCAINREQRWHLDELVTLVAVMRIWESPAFVIRDAFATQPDRLAQLTLAAARCVGLDPRVVAAEASTLAPLTKTQINNLLHENRPAPHQRPTPDPSRVAEEAELLTEILTNGTPWMRARASALLAAAGTAPTVSAYE